MKPKLIYLEWIDAFTSSGWHDRDEIKVVNDDEFYIKEAGWLLEENDKCMIFASSWSPETDSKVERFLNVHKIPKTWIRKRKVLKV